MKKILTRSVLGLAALLFVSSSFASPISSFGVVLVKESNTPEVKEVKAADWASQMKDAPEVQLLNPDMMKMGLEQFLSLTPSKYKQLTGKKLGLKKSLELKAAQKIVKGKMKASDGQISKGLYILLAILGLAWIAMGIMDDWSGSDWIVNLILSVLCWLPGVIHAFIKMKKYY